MIRKTPKQVRINEEVQKRKELSAQYDANVAEIRAACAAPWDSLSEDDQLAVIYFHKRPYETTISREEFIEEGVRAWKRERPIVVTGIYRDEQRLEQRYQRTFLGYTRAVRPAVFIHLKKLLPLFAAVFGSKPSSADRMFDWYAVSDLVVPGMRIHGDIDSTILEIQRATGEWFPEVRVEQNAYHSWDHAYRWGEHAFLMDLLWLDVLSRRGQERESHRLRIERRLREKIRIAGKVGRKSKLHAFIDRVTEKFIEGVSGREFFISESNRAMMNILQTQDQKTVDNFLEFVRELLEWARVNGLEKDWVLQYSCYFLDRELHVDDADMLTDPLPVPDDPSLYTFPFDFRFDEWFPGYESKEKYEERVKLAFQGKLYAFFQDEGRRLNLDRANDDAVRSVTKPGEYDQLKWLIAWNEGATVKQIAKSVFRTESAISNALKRLGEFQLPIRKGSIRPRLSWERVKEINDIKTSTF